LYKKTNHFTDSTKTLTVREETYLKNQKKYDTIAKKQQIIIRRKDGIDWEWAEYKFRPLYIKEETYLANPAKYNMCVTRKVIITLANGTDIERDNYIQLQEAIKKNPPLPNNCFTKNRITNKKYNNSHYVTEEEKYNVNHCDCLHLFVWWDQSLLEKDSHFVKIKNHPNCYVIREGVFNIETCELCPPYIALQKFANLNYLEAFYVCTDYLKCVDKDDIRYYTYLHYGVSDIPQVDSDALNYIKDDNILGTDAIGYAKLFEILKDTYLISKDVIFEMINRDLIIVDSNYNICFLSYDTNGNITSVYKMSRYKNKPDEFSFNHYITKRNVGFVYCSTEAEQYNIFDSITVFDNPIELMSYLTLEAEANPLVPSFLNAGCYIAMINGNSFAVREWINKHVESGTMNIAISYNIVNKYIKNDLLKSAEALKLPKTQELITLVSDYAHNAIMKSGYSSFRLNGWNALLKLYYDKLSAAFIPLSKYEIFKYA